MILDALAGIHGDLGGRSRRQSSYDTTGGNKDRIAIPAGSSATLAEIKGAGVIRHIWITTLVPNEDRRRDLIIRMWWDGQDHLSVEAPLGEFFGNGWGESYRFLSMPLICTERDGNALTSYWPMPFADGARIEIENRGEEDVEYFYFYVDYDEVAEMPSDLRFHAQYRCELTKPEGDGDRENEWTVLGPEPKNPSDKDNYLFCECSGSGRFLGVNYYCDNPGPIWYGEGDDMFLIDGEPWPGLHGTGTEDYFGQSWSPDEIVMHPFFGTARAPGRENKDPLIGWLGRTHCYRFHLADPIRFTESLRASIEHGHANTLTLHLQSVAYWYQTMPSATLLPLPSREEMKLMPKIGPVEIHRWRDAWRSSRGGGPLWGNEHDKPDWE